MATERVTISSDVLDTGKVINRITLGGRVFRLDDEQFRPEDYSILTLDHLDLPLGVYVSAQHTSLFLDEITVQRSDGEVFCRIPYLFHEAKAFFTATFVGDRITGVYDTSQEGKWDQDGHPLWVALPEHRLAVPIKDIGSFLGDGVRSTMLFPDTIIRLPNNRMLTSSAYQHPRVALFTRSIGPDNPDDA